MSSSWVRLDWIPVISLLISSGETTITTNTFRVEKINDCCCKCRLLNVDTSGNITSTNYFVTINLKCMCVLKCLSDIALEYA